MVENGADVNIKRRNGATALVFALSRANEGKIGEIIKVLVAAGSDVNVRISPNDMTPLMLAAVGDYKEAAKALIVAGANVNAAAVNTRDLSMFGCTALRIANFSGNEEVAQVIKESGGRTDTLEISFKSKSKR